MEPVRWSFHTPTRLVFGEGTSLTVGEELKALGCARPMLVTDVGLVKAGIVGRITSALEGVGLEPIVFDKVCPNPSVPTVAAGVEAAGSAGADAIVAVGGGSPIDAAKAIAMMCAQEGSTLDYEVGKRDITTRGLPVVTIPTTAGTGSELTYYSVITDPDAHRKFDVGSPLMAPIVALDDPELTYELPRDMTAATGMDALTHAIEAFTSRGAAHHTDALALQAIRVIGKYLPRAVGTPDDLKARQMMLMASAMAGMAFANAGLGAVHGLSAPVGGHLDAPHGAANAALLPFVMDYNLYACLKPYAAIAKTWGADVAGGTREECAKAAIKMVRTLSRDVGIPTLGELGVTPDIIPTLARDSMGEYSNSNDNPAPLQVEDAEKILMNALG